MARAKQKPIRKTTTGKGATASNTNPADGKAFLSKLNSSKTKKKTTTRKPYETKAGPAQPVAKPRTKKKSTRKPLLDKNLGLMGNIKKGIKKAGRAVKRKLK